MSEDINIPKLFGCCKNFCPWATLTDNPSLHGCTKGKFVKPDDEGCEDWKEKHGLSDLLRDL